MLYVDRILLNDYMIIPHYIQKGWLYKMGAVDIAGCGPVHLVGGCAAVVACIYLGPRFVRKGYFFNSSLYF